MNKKQIEKEFDLFDVIWEKAVKPTLEDNNKKYKNYGYLIRSAKNKARRYFYREEQMFVCSYMVDETINIDRHKIASCMLKAILVAKPFRVSFFQKLKHIVKNTNMDDAICLMNQYTAINVAVLILEGYISSDPDKQIKHSIHFPEPFPDGPKDYIKDVCLDLYYTNPKEINTITYANVFFLWEKYSCRKIQGNNLEVALRKYLEKDDSIQNIENFIVETRMKSEETNKPQLKSEG